jgi:hypothetical protein
MKATFITIGIILAIIVILCGIDLGTGYFGVLKTKTVGKAQENAKYQVFKQTQSYNDGMAQQLSKLKTEYDSAKTSQDKGAITFKIKQDYANFDESNLQSESLKNWLIQVRGF